MALIFDISIIAILFWSSFMFTDALKSTKNPEDIFKCFKCSYSVTDSFNGLDCMNNTSVLPRLYYTLDDCDRYCTIQERWNKRTKEVDSVFRSCNKFQGNECTEEATFITCHSSCKGDYCNNATVGKDHVIRFNCNSATCSRVEIHVCSWMTSLCVLLLAVFAQKLLCN